MSFKSETLRELSDELDFSADYRDVTQIGASPRGRLFTAMRAGRKLVLKAAASGGARDVEMLKREYETAAPLSHPHIAGVYTYEAASPVGPCIVMEYVEGETLSSWLSRSPSQGARRRVFSQLLDVIDYLHRKGVMHNDLSGSNILISSCDNDVKIIDFGFSDDDAHCMERGRGCTRRYASPELLAGKRLDSRSDIYSLGMLMKDVFGLRYAPVSSHATMKNPAMRYRSIAAFRRAWMRCRRFPAVVGALALLVAASVMAAEFVGLKKEYEAVTACTSERQSQLDEYKERVDTWLAVEAAAARERISASDGDRSRAMEWERLVSDWTEFWMQLVGECPEEIKDNLTQYIAYKSTFSFPKSPDLL